MLKFEWNALRAGDKVLVHDPRSAQMALSNGVVALVDAHRSAANGVGIRVTAANGDRTVLWPSFLAVHADPRDPAEPCWRCEALNELAEVRPHPALVAQGAPPRSPGVALGA